MHLCWVPVQVGGESLCQWDMEMHIYVNLLYKMEGVLQKDGSECESRYMVLKQHRGTFSIFSSAGPPIAAKEKLIL